MVTYLLQILRLIRSTKLVFVITSILSFFSACTAQEESDAIQLEQPSTGFYSPTWLSTYANGFVVGEFSLPVYHLYDHNGQVTESVTISQDKRYDKALRNAYRALQEYVVETAGDESIGVALGEYTHQRINAKENLIVTSGYYAVQYLQPKDTLSGRLPYFTVRKGDSDIHSIFVVDTTFDFSKGSVENRADIFSFSICADTLFFDLAESSATSKMGYVILDEGAGVAILKELHFDSEVLQEIFPPDRKSVFTDKNGCAGYSIYNDGHSLFTTQKVIGSIDKQKHFIYDVVQYEAEKYTLIIRDRSGKSDKYWLTTYDRDFNQVEQRLLFEDLEKIGLLTRKNNKVYGLVEADDHYSIHSESIE